MSEIYELPEALQTLETPSVLVDLDIMERNLHRMAESAKTAGVKLRPHTKTHKNTWIAHKQLQLGSTGITVAKLSEAEVMANAGIRDILIAYPIVGKTKLARLRQLMLRADVTVSTDDLEVARGLSHLGEAMGCKVAVYVDVNTGLGRCGREPGEETALLVKEMSRLPGLRVTGLMTHAGNSYGSKSTEELRVAARNEAELLVMTQVMLKRDGIHIEQISVGSTPTAAFIAEQIGVTEMRPGSYVFNDGTQRDLGVAGADDCALYVAATVVSAPRDGMVIIDGGSKTFSSDLNPHRKGYGTLYGRVDVIIERLSEEHGTVRVPEGMKLSVGQQLLFLPNHCCTTTNMHDQLIGIRNGRMERVLTVDARGKVQ
ncbi:alanine racemase [Paenibacillus sp. V4I5]|uniref:alanine racemase n=1 Tax=Paenibacillus sp. V4I5 TaxID=3042306 RepID=UPI00279182D7|nr:alanine racemase [Paenibacillus sp. V4I5]MDQ0920228.1 D-serine deaminase-like pyridoxal phosphate-dependent protein [Paenibacillus sp. V4I5]